MALNPDKLENEILKNNLKERDVSDNKYAFKEFETIVIWIVRISTGGLIAGTIGFVIARLLKLL